MSRPRLAISVLASRFIRAQSTLPKALTGCVPRNTFSATERSGTTESSWCTIPIELASASPAERSRTAALDSHRAVEFTMDPGDDLHHRRFAGTIFADQSVDFVGIQREADILERQHAAEMRFETFALEEALRPRSIHCVDPT